MLVLPFIGNICPKGIEGIDQFRDGSAVQGIGAAEDLEGTGLGGPIGRREAQGGAAGANVEVAFIGG